ncbi:MAG: hypothetical protein JSS66_05210 [Armatimonadetes bacterium]|nr:hypothetical protein [Armatimonadota bacterium]
MSDFSRYLDAELSKFLVRKAQFGGRGGTPQSWMPGASNLGQANRNMGKGGQNDFSASMGLDQIMGATRRNTPEQDVPDINLERWLESFHDDIEQDRKGYDLNPEQRKSLTLREKIRRREKFLADQAAASSSTQKPKYKDGTSLEQNKTMESSLEDRHENDGKIYSDRDIPQIPPSRVMANNYARMLRLAQESIFDQNADGAEYKRTHTSTEATPVIPANEPKDPMGEEENQKKLPATGKMTKTVNPVGPTGQNDFEQAVGEMYTDDAGKPSWGERTLAFDYPAEDEIGDHSGGTQPLAADPVFNNELDKFLNNEPDDAPVGNMEQQLTGTRPRKRFRPQDLRQNPGFSETDAKHLTNPKFPNTPWGNADFYNGGAFADHGLPLPKV